MVEGPGRIGGSLDQRSHSLLYLGLLWSQGLASSPHTLICRQHCHTLQRRLCLCRSRTLGSIQREFDFNNYFLLLNSQSLGLAWTPQPQCYLYILWNLEVLISFNITIPELNVSHPWQLTLGIQCHHELSSTAVCVHHRNLIHYDLQRKLWDRRKNITNGTRTPKCASCLGHTEALWPWPCPFTV